MLIKKKKGALDVVRRIQEKNENYIGIMIMITLKDYVAIVDDGRDLITKKKAENNINGMYSLALYDM